MVNSPPTDSPAVPTEAHGPSADAVEADDRRCLACGYLLCGLGPEPRCPECGLLNIPEEFRRQVWELVDSGKWFFSGFFHPFRKRPPGWWWALDREGDVRRSWRYAVINIVVTSVMIGSVIGLADGWIARTHHVYLTHVQGQVGPPFVHFERTTAHSLIGWREVTPELRVVDNSGQVDWRFASPSTYHYIEWAWAPSVDSLLAAVPFTLWIWLIWAYPAFVGISTQIRRGLPSFAKAPRTILAAANYESHRMIYHAALLSAVVVGGTWRLRATVPAPGFFWLVTVVAAALVLLTVTYFACGWIGPVRSDYTRQLVQSRFHAGRIIVMYAVGLPLLTMFTLGSAVELVRSSQ